MREHTEMPAANRRTVVVLDPEPVVRSTASAILKRAGYAVQIAGEFEEALQMIKSSRPDLLLINMSLNRISGRDAVRHIKSRCPNLRVLMMSGVPDDKDAGASNSDEFEMIPKPFNSADLTAKVRQVLQD